MAWRSPTPEELQQFQGEANAPPKGSDPPAGDQGGGVVSGALHGAADLGLGAAELLGTPGRWMSGDPRDHVEGFLGQVAPGFLKYAKQPTDMFKDPTGWAAREAVDIGGPMLATGPIGGVAGVGALS